MKNEKIWIFLKDNTPPYNIPLYVLVDKTYEFSEPFVCKVMCIKNDDLTGYETLWKILDENNNITKNGLFLEWNKVIAYRNL